MGIEPTGTLLPKGGQQVACRRIDTQCDWRVNFGGIWGTVGIREPTSATSAVSGAIVTTPPGDSRP
ncbi:MAG: hypothetical protein QOI88_3546 [Gammaproteobacteria bacterium]|jgi:hypothetical protein|nr:hypothetical protein [Gammaproteobacteria bacterium]